MIAIIAHRRRSPGPGPSAERLDIALCRASAAVARAAERLAG
ncbi:hypothetical protein ABZ912_25740 [Nonomuraea angiospora]